MIRVNFYLNDSTKKESLVYLSVSHNGKREKVSTQTKVFTDTWNSEKQKVKCKDLIQYQKSVNTLLQSLKNETEKKYYECMAERKTFNLSTMIKPLILKISKPQN